MKASLIFVATLLGCSEPSSPPTGNFWSAMSSERAPVPRIPGIVAWADNEMLVWGGIGGASGNELLNDGARYRPTEDGWQTISPVGAPAPRNEASVVWTGTRLFVWGGEPDMNGEGGTFGLLFDDGALYDPGADSWSLITDLDAPDGRSGALAVWTGTEVLGWGGAIWGPDGLATKLSSGFRYDPATDQWQPMNDDEAPRMDGGFFVAWTGAQMLVFDYVEDPPDRDGGLYDPSTDAWTSINVSGMPTGPLCGPVWAGTELLVYARDESAIARYDPARDEWSRTPTDASLCGVPNPVWTGSLVLYWGPGASPPGPRVRFDPERDVVTPMTLSEEPSSRTGEASLWTGREMIVWGGDQDGGAYTNSGALYTP